MPSSLGATPVRRIPLAEQAAAIGMVLRKEFDVAFAFFDAITGSPIVGPETGIEALADLPMQPADVVRFGAAEVSEARLQANGTFQLLMVFSDGGVPFLVAVGEMAALTHTVADLALEQSRLQKWAQSVSERVRIAGFRRARQRTETQTEPGGKPAFDALLRIDHLVRRLRIHKDHAKNRRRIICAAKEAFPVQCVAWIPGNTDDEPVSEGDESITEWDSRQLAALLSNAVELQASGLLIWNHVQEMPWGCRLPRIQNLLAIPVNDRANDGWIVALNKLDVRATIAREYVPFRRGDAALVTPFAGLWDWHVRSSGRYRDLQDLLVGLARSLTAAIDAKDSYTYGHSERVARIAVTLGRRLKLREGELSDLFLAGLLHDIGKIGIRDAVLTKTGELTPEEFEHVKQHVTIGYSILQNLKPLSHLLPGVRNHHERYDGRGYPDGLAREAIPLMARILAVADAYDAMSTRRPYREAIPILDVEAMLASGAGVQWDPRVIAAFQECRHEVLGIRQRGVGDSLRYVLHDALRGQSSSTAQICRSLPSSN